MKSAEFAETLRAIEALRPGKWEFRFRTNGNANGAYAIRADGPLTKIYKVEADDYETQVQSIYEAVKRDVDTEPQTAIRRFRERLTEPQEPVYDAEAVNQRIKDRLAEL